MNYITSPPYQVGDYYNDGRHTGVVFEVSNGGYHGKIIATHQNEGVWCENSHRKDICTSEVSGIENKQKVFSQFLQYSYQIYELIYNSFGYSKVDYYLPAIQELQKLRMVRGIVNNGLRDVYGEELDNGEYVSSTEKDNRILTLNMGSGNVWDRDKSDELTFRLAFEF